MNILDFGADPTGQQDCAPAFQAAADQGGLLEIPAGTFAFDTSVVIQKPLVVRGAGAGYAGAPLTAPLTTLIARSLLMDFCYINAHGVQFQDVSVTRVNAANTGQEGNAFIIGAIPCTPTQGWVNSTFTRCQIYGHCRACWFINAASWVLEGCQIDTVFGVQIENRCNFDAGDAAISNSTIRGAGAVGGCPIAYASGGGLKISNTKLLGGQYGLWVLFTETGSIGPQLANVSIEGYTTHAIYVQGPGRCDGFTIVGCHLDGPTPIISMDCIRQVAITGNVFGTNTAGQPVMVFGPGVQQYVVSGNVISGDLWNGGLAGPAILAQPGSSGVIGTNMISGCSA